MPGGWPLGFELCNGQDIGTDTANSRGTTVTCGTNTMGSWAQLIASTAGDACWAIVTVQKDGADAGGGVYCGVDIGIGGAGSETLICSQLVCFTDNGLNGVITYSFPLSIPAGTRIAARGQTTGANPVHVSMQLFDGAFTQQEGIAGVDSIGFDAANSRGTAITPGAANTKGSYTQLIASSAKDYIGLMIGLDSNANNQSTFWLFDIAIGGAGSEKIILPNMSSFQTAYAFYGLSGVFLPIAVPTGTRIAARAQSKIGTTPCGMTLYGAYQ